MTGIAILDVAIGLVVVYLLLGLLCTVAGEFIAQAGRLRARTLRQGIETLLADQKYKRVTESLYSHPVVSGLRHGERDPSYISGTLFAKAFLSETEKRLAAIGDDLTPGSFIANIDRIVAKFEQLKTEIYRKGEIVAQRADEAEQVLEQLRQRERALRKGSATPGELATAESQLATGEDVVKNARREQDDYARLYLGYAGTMKAKMAQIEAEQICYRHVAEVMRSFVGTEGASLAEVEGHLARWYEEAMVRVAGWYRRKIAGILLAVAAVTALAFNADTIGMAHTVWVDHEVRDMIRRAADSSAQRCSLAEIRAGTAAACSTDELARTIEARRRLPLGWHADAAPLGRTACPEGAARPCAPAPFDYVLWLFGILLSMLAIWFAAIFWFDLLKRFVSLGSSGKPPARG
jgi:hypothetical protein